MWFVEVLWVFHWVGYCFVRVFLLVFVGALSELGFFFFVHLGALSYTPCIIGLRSLKFAPFLYTILLMKNMQQSLKMKNAPGYWRRYLQALLFLFHASACLAWPHIWLKRV